jgi:putative transposase
MPTRNLIKQYGGEQFYHIYSRGVAKQPIFLDTQDYEVFLSLLKRYLSDKPAKSDARVSYPWYQPQLELLAYCLMPNHIHLLVYQHEARILPDFMRSLLTSYSMYFNRRYKRVGPVFQSRYLASTIDRENYLEHISRYIHLNPKDWKSYPYSSLAYYMSSKKAEWIKPKRILDIFSDQKTYWRFLEDYEAHKQLLDELKFELAHE